MNNPDMRIIALTGRKGAGKDHVAQVVSRLCAKQKMTYSKYAYGNYIKKIAAVISGTPIKLFYLPANIRDKMMTIWRWEEVCPVLKCAFPPEQIGEYVTVRQMEQLVATDIFRLNFSPMSWIKLVDNELNQSYKDTAIITDLRHKAEVASLSKWKLTIIRVVDPKSAGVEPGHITEAEIDKLDADFEFTNNRDLPAQEWAQQATDQLAKALFPVAVVP